MSDDDEEEMLELIEMDDISFLKKNRDALTQSIAERVCEVLMREISEESEEQQKAKEASLDMDAALYLEGIIQGIVCSLSVITHPRDWAKILSEKEEK